MRRSLLFCLFLPATVIAQSSGDSFSITNSSLEPSTSDLHGGSFSLRATVGQPATEPVTAGAFNLTGGFNAVGGSDVIFANSFEL